MTFSYQAVDVSGASVRGQIEAADRRDALRLLGDRGLVPSHLESSKASVAVLSPGSAPPAWNRTIQRKEVTGFTREVAALLDAGIPVLPALTGIAEQVSNAALKSIIHQVCEDIRQGDTFSKALSKHGCFSSLYVSMVAVGEEAGVLDAALNDLADLMEHEDEIRSEVVSAVSYPAFVLIFGLVTVVLLLTFVMPRLFGMLTEMMNTLPLPTLILLRLSGFVQSYWPLLAVIGGVSGFGLWKFLSTPQGQWHADRIKLKLPLVGGVFESAALSRFSRTLGILTRSGISLLPALQIVQKTIGNRVLGDILAQVAEETRSGDTLAGPLRKSGMFPPAVIQMIRVGEETGKLDRMLLKVATIEERRMRNRTKTLISLLAPALILGIGALIGFIVIALLLPIFKMSQAIN